MHRIAKAKIEVPVFTGKRQVKIERREITLRVIATAEGYAMVRRKAGAPFVLEETRLTYQD